MGADLTRLRPVLALVLLAAVLTACGGTIYFGRSSPNSDRASDARGGNGPLLGQQIPSPPPGTTAGSLIALDSRTGNRLWQTPVPMGAVSQPVVANGLVFVQGGYDCRSTASGLAAFDAKDGKSMWEAPTTANRYGFSMCGSEFPPRVGAGIALTVGTGQTGSASGARPVVHGLDPKTARELWTTEGEEPAAAPGTVIILVASSPASSVYKVRGLNPLTGAQQWEAGVTASNLTPLIAGETAVVPGTDPNGDYVSAVDITNGALRWQLHFTHDQQFGGLVLGDVAVYSVNVYSQPMNGQGPDSGRIVAVDVATGQELWRQTVTPGVGGPALAVPRAVYVMQVEGRSTQRCSSELAALDSRSGLLKWRYNDSGCPNYWGDLAGDGSTTAIVLGAGSGTKIAVLDMGTGSKLWEKPIATSGPYPLVQIAVAGGVVYMAVSGRFIAPPPSD